MFEFRPAVSAALRDLLDRYDAPVQEVIADESCLRGFNAHDSGLVSFLTEHASQVLDLALYSENPKLSSKALALFSKDNDAMVQAIIEENLLPAAADLVFSSQPDYPIVSRFASITQLVCFQEPTNLMANCPYIYQFLPFSGFRLVLGMFEELFQDQEKTEMIQNQLKDLIGQIKTLISNTEKTFTADINDANAVMFSGLFKLVSVIKDLEFYKTELRSPEFLTILARTFPTKNITVLDAQWEAVANLVNPENANALEPIFKSTIIPLLSEGNTTFFHQYQASLLNVILVIAQTNEQIRKYLLELNFQVELHDIVAHFPHHTLAHLAVTNFIVQSAKMEEFETLILSEMLPFCEQVMSRELPPIELKAFVWDLFNKFKKACEAGELSDKFKEAFAAFDEDCTAKLNEMTKISEQEYGGQLPEPMDNSADDEGISSLSPEQIMQLLKFLTSNSGLRR